MGTTKAGVYITTTGALPVKAPVFLLLAFVAACLGIAFTPASVHAEGFVSKAVKCLLRAQLPGYCKNAAAQQSADSGAAKSTGSGKPIDNTPGAATSSPNTHLVTGQPLAAPDATLESRVALPNAATMSYQATSMGGYAAHASAAALNKTAQVAAGEYATVGLLEQSEVGWRIAGVPWFLWAIGAVGLVSMFVSVKRIVLSKN